MTFHYKNHCAVESAFEHSGEAELHAGSGALLTAVLVSSGRCSVFRGEEALIAPAGSLLFWQGAQHLVPVGGCHLVGVTLLGAAPRELAEQLDGPVALDGAALPDAAELLNRLATPLPEAEASALAYALVCALAAADAGAAPLPPLVAAAIADIREHYAEVYGVEELAKGLNVSKSHLVRSFSAATGVSPGRYLTGVRIEAVKRLLLNSEYSLEVVASLTGFSGANYLCKVFKRVTGETPQSWRKKAAGHTLETPAVHELEEMLFL